MKIELILTESKFVSKDYVQLCSKSLHITKEIFICILQFCCYDLLIS